MRFLNYGLVLAFWPFGAAGADICHGSGPVEYPMNQIVMADAAALRIDLFETFPMAVLPPPPDTPYDVELWAALRALPQPQSDILVLGLVDVAMMQPLELNTAPHAWADEIFDTARKVLERHGLHQQSEALGMVAAAVPNWEEGAAWRKARLLRGYRENTEEADLILNRYFAAAYHFRAAVPSVADRIGQLIASDPELAARYGNRRRNIPDEDRLAHLELELLQCLSLPGVEAAPGQYDYRKLEAPRGTLLLLSHLTFSDVSRFPEAGLEFLGDLTGNAAPEIVDALASAGLPDQASVLHRILARLPQPFPRDVALRQQAIAELDAEARERILRDFQSLDVAVIRAAMVEIARKAGILPQ